MRLPAKERFRIALEARRQSLELIPKYTDGLGNQKDTCAPLELCFALTSQLTKD